MQYSVRFFISWILSSVVMYIAFYWWHGIFLSDLSRITFSKPLFLVLAALVYPVISYVLYRSFETKILSKYISAPFLRGIICGILVGFILFAFITVLGVSFTKHVSLKYLMADCAWQVVEQVMGGLIIALGKKLIFEPQPEEIFVKRLQ